MPDAPASSGIPQFGKAEYSVTQQPGRCAICQQTLGSAYYRVRGALACEACALRARSETPSDSHSAFANSVLFGIGGAILGLIAYSAFTIATRIYIGYMALAVGYLIGKAMKFGSKGSGGRKYQIVAVILTYAAVSLSAIPIDLAHVVGLQNVRALVPILGPLLFAGLTSPFMDLTHDPFNGAIGLLILAVGMRFAWQFTAGTETSAVVGPFANTPASAAPPAPL
jgi:hypothetical protein